jgi:hypothetical protein
MVRTMVLEYVLVFQVVFEIMYMCTVRTYEKKENDKGIHMAIETQALIIIRCNGQTRGVYYILRLQLDSVERISTTILVLRVRIARHVYGPYLLVPIRKL